MDEFKKLSCKEKRKYTLVLLSLLIGGPIFVWLIFYLFPTKWNLVIENTNITADGMLGYIGAVASSLIALFAAIYGVIKSEKNNKKSSSESRRLAIRPSLWLELNRNDDGSFLLTVWNHSEGRAIGIDLYEHRILPFVSYEQPEKVNVIFNDSIFVENAVLIDSFPFEYKDGYPNELSLLYNDIDGNLIIEQFKRVEYNTKFVYESQALKYESIGGKNNENI